MELKKKFKTNMNTIFIHIPKTGGTTISESLIYFHRFFGWSFGSEFNRDKDKVLLKSYNYGPTQIGHIYYKSLINGNYLEKKYFKNSFKFCFVRNPYDRIVSLYKYHKINERLNLDFDNFIKILYTEFQNGSVPPVGLYNIKTFNHDSKLYDRKIFGSQYNLMIKWIPKDIGFIGRFENLNEDVHKLIKILGYNGKNFIIPKLNFTKEDNYLSYFTNRQTIDYVSEIYKKDIRRFGYKFL
jgi:hypothetical protein